MLKLHKNPAIIKNSVNLLLGYLSIALSLNILFHLEIRQQQPESIYLSQTIEFRGNNNFQPPSRGKPNKTIGAGSR